jgi:probable FeS assembly SUF system protein SufT
MSAAPTVIEVLRDCRATLVPFGEQVTIAAGERVRIMQQLGGSLTVLTEEGSLMRIERADAGALGVDADGAETDAASDDIERVDPEDSTFDMDLVTAALHSVYDPEIPVSIVELGLVYRCEEQRRPDGTRRIEIDMSMTAPGCGMGDILREDAARAVRAVPGVDDVEVTLVWDPPWTMHRMSEATRLELGLL